MDVVARLKSIADLKTGAPIPEWANTPNGWGESLSKMCKDAIAEIEHLRSLAGAVSQGPSFEEIRKNQGAWYGENGHPVLKAFDGA